MRKGLNHILEALEAVCDERSIPGIQLEVARGDDVAPDPLPDANTIEVDPYVPVTLLRVTKSARAAGSDCAGRRRAPRRSERPASKCLNSPACRILPR